MSLFRSVLKLRERVTFCTHRVVDRSILRHSDGEGSVTLLRTHTPYSYWWRCPLHILGRKSDDDCNVLLGQ